MAMAAAVRLLNPSVHVQMLCASGPSLCRWAALQGQEAVRMAWGEIQEPSALLSLLTHLPDSYLCEVKPALD